MFLCCDVGRMDYVVQHFVFFGYDSFEGNHWGPIVASIADYVSYCVPHWCEIGADDEMLPSGASGSAEIAAI